MPPQPVRELRGLISYRQRLVKTGVVFRNRLQSLLHSHNLVLPEEGLVSQEWWARQYEAQQLKYLKKKSSQVWLPTSGHVDGF